MDNIKIPNHVGIILDGNGRWAKEKGLKRTAGHLAGYKNLLDISKYIFDKGTKYLSVFAFSTENFNRPQEEVDYLMDLFIKGMFSLGNGFFWDKLFDRFNNEQILNNLEKLYGVFLVILLLKVHL